MKMNRGLRLKGGVAQVSGMCWRAVVELDINRQELEKEGEYREMVRSARDLRKRLNLTQNIMVSGISSTSSTVTNKDFLKEVGAEKGKKINKESEMKEVDIKKEIKLGKEKHYIGIKK